MWPASSRKINRHMAASGASCADQARPFPRNTPGRDVTCEPSTMLAPSPAQQQALRSQDAWVTEARDLFKYPIKAESPVHGLKQTLEGLLTNHDRAPAWLVEVQGDANDQGHHEDKADRSRKVRPGRPSLLQ